jgi:nucleotide-binding universal stress UspA family protein
MFKHLLVPLDGSNLAEAILPFAQAWAQSLGARVTLLHITEPHAPSTVHGEYHLGRSEEAQFYLSRLAQQLSEAGLSVEGHVHPGDERGVARMIVDQAGELGADLILLNTHGQTGLREKLLGSIAQQVLHEGRVPVLLIRPQREEQLAPKPVRHILLPLDGESVHEPAVQVAEELAKTLGATIHLLNVVPTTETLTGQESAPGELMPNAMRAVLDLAQNGGREYLQRMRGLMRSATTGEIARGDPAKMIVTVALRVQADLIVMATHGRMGMGAFWSASVAPKVLSEYVGPLLLLRAAEER